jgi:tetratricopeptide (TPR) repeat protein
MKGRTLFFVTFFTLLSLITFSQKRYLDSLLATLTEGKDDSMICVYLRAYVENESDNSIWPIYNERLKKLAEKNSKTGSDSRKTFYIGIIADAVNNEGFLKQEQGKFAEAIKDYQKALEIKLDVHDRAGAANSLNNIGYIYYAAGDYKKAVDFYKRCLKIQEEYDKVGASVTLVNIANVCIVHGDTAKYIELIKKSLQYRLQLNDKRGIANCYNSLGAVYSQQRKLEQGFDYSLRALKIFEEIGYEEGIGNTYNQLGGIYHRMDNLDKSLEYYKKGLDVNRKIGDLKNLSASYVNSGLLYFYKKKYKKARAYLQEGLKIARKSSELKYIKPALKGLYILDSATGNKEQAQKLLTEYNKVKDSLSRKTNIVIPEFKSDSLTVDTTSGEAPLTRSLDGNQSDSFSTLIVIICVALAVVLLGLMLFIRRKK